MEFSLGNHRAGGLVAPANPESTSEVMLDAALEGADGMVLTEDGRRSTLFRDDTDGRWYKQRYE